MQQMEQSLGEIIEHINTASAERNPNAPVSNSLNYVFHIYNVMLILHMYVVCQII